jgi:hypothetical protein
VHNLDAADLFLRSWLPLRWSTTSVVILWLSTVSYVPFLHLVHRDSEEHQQCIGCTGCENWEEEVWIDWRWQPNVRLWGTRRWQTARSTLMLVTELEGPQNRYFGPPFRKFMFNLEGSIACCNRAGSWAMLTRKWLLDRSPTADRKHTMCAHWGCWEGSLGFCQPPWGSTHQNRIRPSQAEGWDRG